MREQEKNNMSGSEQKKPFEIKMDAQLKKIPDYPAAKPRRKTNIFVKLMVAVMVIGISVSLALGILFVVEDALGIGDETREIVVDVPENSTVADVAKLLEEKGLIKSSFLFRAYYKFAKVEGGLQYGTYVLRTDMSYDALVAELQKYSVIKDQVKITLPEGLTLYQMATLLEENGVCDAKEFISAVDNVNFGFAFEELSENPLRFHKLEGYLFPETYFFYQNDNPLSVAKRLLQTYQDRVSSHMNAKLAATGLTQEQVIILASIVQMEAGNTTEMRKVASVYLNRVRNSAVYARLQADPTTKYSKELQKQMTVINQDVLDAYDTYVGLGLPPGPICNPGLEAILAVLEPEDTPYYYFCTNLKTLEFFYAETYEQHKVNLRKAGLR